MYSFQFIYRLLGLYILITLMSGCSWTPRVETSIYKDSQVSVSLITVSEESFEADHPVTFQLDTISRIFNGLYLKHNKRLLQKIFSSENDLQPVFTEEQINILIPQFQQAFSQVTTEEHVAFQTQGDPVHAIPAIKGIMYVKSEDLYVSLSFPALDAQAASKIAGRTTRPDQDEDGKPAVVFQPKEALQEKKQPHWFLGGAEKNHVVINLPLLASLKPQHSPSAIQADQKQITSPRRAASKDEKTLSQDEVDTSSGHNGSHSDTQMLLEEIKTLRKELADQKRAIEKLKQE